MIHYCSLECQDEHWVKVHRKHCSTLAASVVPGYQHKEEECTQCLAVAAQGGPEAVSDPESPVYPCILKRFDGSSKSLLTHHPFSLDGDPEDRIERVVITIKKLLLKMALSNHKVMETCSEEMGKMLAIMDLNRLMVWMLRKTKPHPEASVSLSSLHLGSDIWEDLMHKSGRKVDEYALSDDPSRIFDICAILHNILDYIEGPVSMLRDFKDMERMFPEDLQSMMSRAQRSTFLATVDRLLDAMEHQLIPYAEVVKIICNGEVRKSCSICDKRVTVTEVTQIKKRLGRVACFFNILNMGIVRCADPICDLCMDEHPSRIEYLKWYPLVYSYGLKYRENLCHFCFKLSSHGVVHRCGHCLTKVYCSRACQAKDWDLIHSKICKGKGVARKLKCKAKERRELGDARVEEQIQAAEAKHLSFAFKNGPFGAANRFFQFGQMLQEMKERF